MPDNAVKPRKLTAMEIIQTMDNGRTYLWTNWMKERQLTSFYNSDKLPQDDEECGDDAPVSLGIGYRFLKRPIDQLLDTILTKPGFIKTEVCYPLQAQRQFKVERNADEELNKIVQPRMASIMRSLCGRAMITGRGYLFRLSRWDWKFRTGRLICAPDAPDDIMDSDFRDWGFTGKLTLRDLDERIEMTRKYPGYFGWAHDSLMSLKRYIIRTTFAQKEATEQWVIQQATVPFDIGQRMTILDVYWYFTKNGERNEETGEEKVDLYCVSRWGCGSGIYTEEVGGVVYKALDIMKAEDGTNEVMYYLPNAFESAKECLLPMILDARIDGEQEMNQVDGVGKIMLPRLQSMEHLSMALLEGVGFGVQPNWQYSNAVDAKTIELLGKTGLNPWDAVPAGLSIMQKSQSFQGLNQALQMLQMLGMSAESDAQTGEMSPLGQSQAKFKAEADQLMSQIDVGMSRRKEMSFICLDELANLITETLSRPFDQWKKGDAGYYDALTFQKRMLLVHKVLPAEYSPERMRATCRRLAGNMDRNQAGMKAAQTLQVAGGAMAPEGVRFFQKEIIRAGYDDSVADYAIPDEPVQDQTQVMGAQLQNSMALVSLMVPVRQPKDNVMVHLPQHIMAIEAHLRLAQQAGGWTMFEREGCSALLVHCSQDAQGVPAQSQQKVGMLLKQTATAIQNLPLLNETTDLSIKQQKLQLEAGKLQLSSQHEQNLVADRGVKNDLKNKALMVSLHQFVEQQRNNGVTRAAQLLKMMDESGDGGQQSDVAPSPVAA